ncbi:MAG TPA: hypothetical protein VFT22_02030, partial [Kofleriaceae bacterium]|nr:hypothetical protein [Kofleriaceae bacterium]
AGDVVARVHGAEHRAIGAAVLALLVTAAALWAARWVRASWLHWLALLCIPAAIAVLWMWWSGGALGDDIRALPLDTLKEIGTDPTLTGAADAANQARALYEASEHGSLVPELALRPALEALAIALVLALAVWGWSNRRVLRAA